MRTFAEEIKHYKDDAINMTESQLEAQAAQLLGDRFCMRPEVIFEWSQIHKTSLVRLVSIQAQALSLPLDIELFLDAVLNNKKIVNYKGGAKCLPSSLKKLSKNF